MAKDYLKIKQTWRSRYTKYPGMPWGQLLPLPKHCGGNTGPIISLTIFKKIRKRHGIVIDIQKKTVQ
jgi:hypothetical protein